MQHPWDQPLGVWWIAEHRPDLTAVLECPEGESLTYAELARRAHQLVHGLRSRGIGAGDVVAYALPNGLDILVWQLATSEAGMRSLALNPALAADEVRGIVEHSDAAALIVHEQYAECIGDVSPTGALRLRVAVGGPIRGYLDVEELVADQPTTLPDDRVAGAPVSYSSGTTGKPKGVWRDIDPVDPTVAADQAKTFAHAFQFLPFEGVHLITAGMHHGGCQGFYLGALHVGQPLVIHRRFDAEATLAAIEHHRITTMYMVPTQFVRLLRLPPETRARYDVSSLQVVVHAAAPCPLGVKQEMMAWWGPVIWETYGGMEGAATIAKPQRWLEKPGTVGRAVRGMSVVILDDDGRELGPDEVGNVYMQSSGPGWEYRDDPDLTASVHRGRAFTIGDIGYLDGDGYLFLCDRANDMIISGGVNIYPAEVEGVLSSHPAVGDVAVIGVPDDEWGEQVKAIVELTGGVEPSEDLGAEMIELCRQRLAPFKCPRTVEFRDELPRTDTGKLVKRLLRDEYWTAAGRNV
jgi:long-chain acyl-CoA synthetase